MKKNIYRATLCTLLTVCLLLAGCGAPASPTPAEAASAAPPGSAESAAVSASPGPSVEEKAITVMITGELNPETASPVLADQDFFIYEMVYEPLVRYGMGGVIEPALAERWEVSEDGKDYTFFLREDVKFSDGSGFTADNVVKSSKLWKADSFSTPFLGAEAIDEHTVVLHFEDAKYPVLIELTFPRPYRIAAESSFDADGNFVKPVGTGRWMIESYVPDEEVVVVKNPFYYGDAPKIDKVICRRVDDGQSRIMALQSGDADISLADLPTEAETVIAGSDTLDTLSFDGTLGFFLMVNENNAALQDINVRKALNYAVDKASIVSNIFEGKAVAGEGIFSPNTPYVNKKNSPGYEYSVEKAQESLKLAGYEDTDGDGIVEKNGVPLSLKLTFQTDEYASWKFMCEFLQAEMKKAGIDIELDLRELSAYYDAIWENREFDIIIYRTYEDSWNPHGFLGGMFNAPEDGAAICWTDRGLIALYGEVIATTDETERQEKYDDMLTMLHENAFVVPLCYPNRSYTYNTRLADVQVASTTNEGIRWELVDIK